MVTRLEGRTGSAPSPLVKLSQAMGGGQTHGLVLAALATRDPALRRRLLKDEAHGGGDPQPGLVAVLNGREIDELEGTRTRLVQPTTTSRE